MSTIQFSSILSQARGLLNDPSGAIYADTPMITLGNKVYRELQTKLNALGITIIRETSASITVPANTTELADGALLPSDLVQPISLSERDVGSTSLEDWIPIEEKFELPDFDPDEYLRYWIWEDDKIKFNGCTRDREVRIRYKKGLGAVTQTTSLIAIPDSEQWMAQRLASVASMTLGSNATRAAALAEDLVSLWSDLKSTLVKKNQSQPVRRRRTRYRPI